MKPPVCKTCKAEEWRHICGGLPEPSVIQAVTIPKPVKAKENTPEVIVKAAKFDRAAYMRDRHAKRKALSSAG